MGPGTWFSPGSMCGSPDSAAAKPSSKGFQCTPHPSTQCLLPGHLPPPPRTCTIFAQDRNMNHPRALALQCSLVPRGSQHSQSSSLQTWCCLQNPIKTHLRVWGLSTPRPAALFWHRDGTPLSPQNKCFACVSRPPSFDQVVPQHTADGGHGAQWSWLPASTHTPAGHISAWSRSLADPTPCLRQASHGLVPGQEALSEVPCCWG